MKPPSKAPTRPRSEPVWMVVFFTTLHLVLYVAALSSVIRRPQATLRGRKPWWVFWLTLNFSSPLWIWLFTRRFALTEIVPFIYYFYGRKRIPE